MRGNDRTLERNYQGKWRFVIQGLVKQKKHPKFRFVQDFYRFHGPLPNTIGATARRMRPSCRRSGAQGEERGRRKGIHHTPVPAPHHLAAPRLPTPMQTKRQIIARAGTDETGGDPGALRRLAQGERRWRLSVESRPTMGRLRLRWNGCCLPAPPDQREGGALLADPALGSRFRSTTIPWKGLDEQHLSGARGPLRRAQGERGGRFSNRRYDASLHRTSPGFRLSPERRWGARGPSTGSGRTGRPVLEPPLRRLPTPHLPWVPAFAGTTPYRVRGRLPTPCRWAPSSGRRLLLGAGSGLGCGRGLLWLRLGAPGLAFHGRLAGGPLW